MYGYEEALGYCVDPDAVRDKDGIAAAVLACDLAATLKAAGARACPTGSTSWRREHGVHATAGVSVRMEPAARDAVVERLRAAPPAGWTTDRPAPDVLVLRRDGERAGRPPVGHGAEAEGVPARWSSRPTTTWPPPGPGAAARMAALRDEVAGLWPGS